MIDPELALLRRQRDTAEAQLIRLRGHAERALAWWDGDGDGDADRDCFDELRELLGQERIFRDTYNKAPGDYEVVNVETLPRLRRIEEAARYYVATGYPTQGYDALRQALEEKT